jgi:molybdate transport system ATP-binding protein
MILDADFVVRRRDHTAKVRLEVGPAEVLALVGPNGSGKTTTLEAIAGLLPVDDGRISIGGTVLSASGVHVPSRERQVGYVFQSGLLFPHLSAIDNVAFGPRSRGMRRRSARAKATAMLEQLGVATLGDRRPAQLSGGQAQRVAIARALATEPQVLLLDEPMSALDAGGAMQLRSHLREYLSSFTGATVLVTHDAMDAMVLADRVAVLDDGQIVQSGTPVEVAASPRTEHVAALVGINLLRGRADGGTVTTADGVSVTVVGHHTGDVFVAFSPCAVALYPEAPEGSPRNRWRCTVDSVAQHGDAVRVALRAPFRVLADITPAAVASLSARPGMPLWATVKASEVSVYPVDGASD